MKNIIIDNLIKESELGINFELLLIPIPQEYTLGKVKYRFNSKTTISFENIDEDLSKLIKSQIENKLDSSKVLKIINTSEISQIGSLDANLKDFQKQQGYKLEVKDKKCIISAETDTGIYYGIQTLLQLITNNDKNSLPEININDYPLLEIRGISDDITRGQVPTVENAKRLIRVLSHYKMNFYFIGYETEFLENSKHPLITKGKGHLKKDEIKELQKYAEKYFVELVPFFQVLGHYDNILTLPEYIDLAEFPGSGCLNIKEKDKVRDFLDDIIENIAKTFDSDYIHIGGDESWDFGKFKSKEMVEEKGLAKAYYEHYKWVYDKCKELGKNKIFMYHDIVVHEKEFLENFPKDVIMFFWKYFTSWKFHYRKAKLLKKYGFPVVVSPTIYNWSRHYPDFEWASKNILSLYEFAKKNELTGGITSQWGDYGHEDLRVNHYYGYILSAGALWSDIDLEYFKRALAQQYFGYYNGDRGDNKIIEALDILISIHKHFSKLPPNFYIKFWEHPFLHKNPKINSKKFDKIEKKADKILDLLKDIKKHVKKNIEDLEYIEFAAKLAKFIAIKFQSSKDIGKTLLGPNVLDNDAIKEGILKELNSTKKLLNELKKDYENLWLKCAKPGGLDRLLKKYSIMDFYYQKKINEINNYINWEDPNHQAEWITVKGKKPLQEDRYYRTEFEIESIKNIRKCLLQAIGSLYMKIYLNGEYLGYVITRNSLSYIMMDNQVRVFDITDILKIGINVLAVESYNFISQHEGINIYLEMTKINGEKTTITSNSNWKSTINAKKGWEKVNYDDTDWETSKSLGISPKFNGRIISPYFEKDIKSMTTYNFSIRSTIEAFLPSIARPFIGLALKILNIE